MSIGQPPVNQLEVPTNVNAIVSPVLSEPLAIVYTEALRVSQMAVPCWQPNAVVADAPNATSTPGGIRRSFDLLAKATRFSRLHQRVTFEYQDMLTPPSGKVPMSPLVKPNEFSITTWMFIRGSHSASLTPSDTLAMQPLPERQLVFMRGDGSELGPYLMIVPESSTNWQLEVGFVLLFDNSEADQSRAKARHGNVLCERLLSKDPAPSDRWIHVAVVVEATKVRLYLNGVLDSQRAIISQYTSAWATRDVGLPFHFGRFPVYNAMVQSRVTTLGGGGVDTSNDASTASSALGLLSFSLSSSKNTSFRHAAGGAQRDFGCFDGWLNQFRFHNRALSSIHVRIVYDELKPSAATGVPTTSRSMPVAGQSRSLPVMTSQHARLLDLHALLIQLGSSPEGIVHFRGQFARWMHLLWRTFLCSGSFQLQQSSLRVLQSLLPYQEPAAVTRALLFVSDVVSNSESGADSTVFGFQDFDGGFVRQLLRMIGFGLMNIQSNRPARADCESGESAHALPWSLMIASGVQGSAFAPTATSDAVVDGKLPSDIAQLEDSAKRRNLFVVNELAELLQRLHLGSSGTAATSWKKAIKGVITSILTGESNTAVSANDDGSEAVSRDAEPARGFLFGESVVQSSTVSDAEVLGSLYLLGDTIETSLRPGAAAQLKLTCNPVRVIAVEASPSPATRTDPRFAGDTSAGKLANEIATCVAVGEDRPSNPKQPLGILNRAEHINVRCDELLPPFSAGLLASEALIEGSTPDSIDLGRALLARARSVCPCVCEQLVRLRAWPGRTPAAPTSGRGLEEPSQGTVEQLLQLMQTGNMLLKCLAQGAQREDFAFEILDDAALASTIFTAATENDGGAAFDTLESIERKAFQLRQRVYAVLIDLGEEGSRELALYLESTTAVADLGAEGSPEQDSQLPMSQTGRLSTSIDDEVGVIQNGDAEEDNEASDNILKGEEEVNTEEDTENDEGLADDSGDELGGAEDEDEDPDEDSEMEEHRVEFVDELMLMGFPEEWCVLALKQTENDIVSASAWIVDNLDYLSKLQISLDKRRESDRDTPRFNEDDDDEVQVEGAEVSTQGGEPIGSPFFRPTASFRASDEDNTVDSTSANSPEDKSSLDERQRDSADTDTRILSFNASDGVNGSSVSTGVFPNGIKGDQDEEGDDFSPPPLNDKEMGRKIFGEMYFPLEEGGYLSNASSPFQSAWRADNVELKAPTSPKSDASASQTKQCRTNEPAFTDSTFEKETARLDIVTMVELLRALERQLMVLYCRFLAVSTLKYMESEYRKRDEADTSRTQPVAFSQILRLLKFVIKRGDQFGSYNPAPGSGDTASSEDIMRRAITFMLAQDSDKNMPHTVEYILEQVETAAWSKHFEASLWTQRELRRPDEQVVAEPAVEVAVWLVDCVFVSEETHANTSLTRASNLPLVQTMLRRLRCSFGATNLPLKCFVLRTISRLLLTLCRPCGARDEPERFSCDARTLGTLVDKAKLTAREVMVAAKQRLARETVQERQLYSLYLQAYVERLHALHTIYTASSDQGEDSNTQESSLLPISTFNLGATTAPGAEEQSRTESLGPCDVDEDAEQVPSTELAFDRKRNRNGLLAYSEDGRSVAYSGNDAWKAACAEQRLSTGQHAWAVRIDKSSSSYIFVGVVTRRFNADSFLGADDHSWGFIGDKALYYQRNRVRAFGEAFGESDTVGVHLDCERGTLAFTKNGSPLGVAFDNVVGEVYPAIALYSRHQRVSLVGGVAFESMDTTLSSEDDMDPSFQSLASQPSLPPWASDADSSSGSIDDCLVACELMASMLERRPVRLALMQAAYQLTTHWLVGSTHYTTTRAGWSLWVDVTHDACERLGFRARERVRTARGNGTVAGVACGRVWVHVDGEAGAWFFHPSKLRVLSVVVVSTGKTPSTSLETASAGDTVETARSAGNRPSEPVSDQVGGMPTSLSFDAFASLAQHTRWGGVARDRELLRVVNDHCESTRTSPWNVSPAALLRLVRDKQQQPGLFDTGVNAGSLVLDNDSSDSKTASLILVARFALLRYFNLALSHSLPFFDLTWRYYAQGNGDKSGVSQPCRLLSACRGSVCLCLKNAFFTSLMQRTANSPRKAEDEYDYPDDLPQLQVNRLKAAAAKCHPGTTKSLFLSLFGQTFEVLHFLPLRTLRMVYSHPMDDGQLRCFKVKFEGEGADDYGGPYREFFSQFFAELQTLKESQADDNKAGANNNNNMEANQHKEAPTACLLPFLMPSPNWRNGVGASREKFVLNASLVAPQPSGSGTSSTHNGRRSLLSESPEEKRQLYRELFVFLGQMLGTCLRTGVCVRLDLATSVWKQLVAEDDATREIAGDLADENTESALTSLKEIDFVAYSLWRNLKAMLDEYERCRESPRPVEHLDEQLAAMDLDFTTTLSDGRTVELRRGGRSSAVSLSNLGEYLRLMLNARVHEASEAVALIKRGLNSILPVSSLGLLTWQELETRVCGVDEIDVALLRANTEYDEDVSPTNEFVLRFWRVLEGMDTPDRRAFLRFVWARSRLPLGAAQFHQKFKIQSLALGGSGGDGGSASSSSSSAPATGSAMDAQLPKSHTCFFALQLPRHSSDEVCRKQLLYAIHNCVEMDGDFRLADAEMTGWTDVSAADQLRL